MLRAKAMVKPEIRAGSVSGKITFQKAAPFPARLVLAQDPSQTVNVQIRWMPADKRYVALFQGGGERPVDVDDVLSLDVQPPKDWKQLVEQARKSPDSAIPGLAKIIDEYKMLKWDAEAGRVLATIQLRKGRAKDAVETCRKVISANADAAWNSPLAPVYWQALLETGNTGALPSLLDKGATADNRGIAAQACIRRGDLLLSQGQTQKALTDGYLRVVYLFADQAGAQAEERGWKLSQEKNKWYQEELAKNGMETIKPTVELKEGLSVIGKRMLDDWLKKAGADGQAMIDAYRKQ